MAAAVRETREETGLEVEAFGDQGIIRTTHEGRQVVLHLIWCRPVSSQAAPASPAVTEVRWVSSEELRALPMPPANARILEQILS